MNIPPNIDIEQIHDEDGYLDIVKVTGAANEEQAVQVAGEILEDAGSIVKEITSDEQDGKLVFFITVCSDDYDFDTDA